MRGTFYRQGEVAPAVYGKPLVIHGFIETQRGTTRKVWLQYMDVWEQCGIQFAPPIDAKGQFWITRKKTKGRHEIELWEGYYLPEALAELEAAE